MQQNSRKVVKTIFNNEFKKIAQSLVSPFLKVEIVLVNKSPMNFEGNG